MSWARVSAGCRWDAVALLRALPRLRAYLVQTDQSRWTLHIERDRDEHELLAIRPSSERSRTTMP